MVVPVASYSFDEISGDFLDHSGHSHDFALNNGLIRSIDGHSNGGVTKNDTGIPVVSNTNIIGSTVWTMMFWQKGTQDGGTWWCRFYSVAEDSGHGILNLEGGLKVQIREAGSSIRSSAATLPVDGLYHHYAATFDGSVGRLYIDSTLVGITPTITSPVSFDILDMMQVPTNNSVMDDLRFFDIALTQTEIADWMAKPVVDDSAAATDIFIYNGTAWVPTSKKIWTGTTWA